MPILSVNLDSVEDVCDQLMDAHHELFEALELNGLERLLVLARLAYVHDQALGRTLSEQARSEFERVRALMIKRAEETRASNLAEDAAGVNSEGGNA